MPPDKPHIALATALVVALQRAGDPQRAAGQQTYMKSTMPFHGVTVPKVRTLARAVLLRHTLPDAETWRAAILRLWRQATHREQRYAAIEVLLAPKHRDWLTPAAWSLVEELIVDGAWWDYVDAIAVNAVGAMLRSHPSDVEPLLRDWANDENVWKRRTAILAQLKFKDATDVPLLRAVIEPSLEHREFFVRKAIGWALRSYAKTDAAFVIDFVHAHADRLSALSKREALKALLKDGTVQAVP